MGGKLISTFLLGMYFLYLTISRRALEIFNCNPVEPDDGFTYTHFTSINCDGGLCRCWDPNHVQLFLVPFSIVAILLMTVGFPVWLFLLLRSKKNAIKEDQYLRALDIAPVETNNPVAFFNRLKYHKMYYHFKPGKVYWIVFIIARKGLISAAGLLFRSNPGFQLSFVLLVLFWAYVQQVQNKPFMSSVERKTVILEHQVKAKMGDELHIQLAARIAVAKAEEKKSRAKQRNKQRNKLVNDFVSNSTGEHKSDMDANKQKLNYFWNYNTVESVLLSSLIIVCVCGVMFESDRFQENQNVPSGNGFGQFVTFQRDLVTYACIIVIFGSMFFYFAVAYSEIFGRLPLWMRKVLCLKEQIDLHKDTDMYGENDGRNSEVHMEANPHMLAERDRLAAQSATAEMEEMLRMQQDQMRREKLRTARLLEKGRTKGGRGKKKKRIKKEMGALRIDGKAPADAKNLELVDMSKTPSISKLKKEGRGKNKKKASAGLDVPAVAELKQTGEKNIENPMTNGTGAAMGGAAKGTESGQWKTHLDKNSGKDYYSNTENGRVTWTQHDKWDDK